MKRILCPTDFSDVAQNGVDYAARFAQLTGAELVLFVVHELSVFAPAVTTGNDSLHDTTEQLQSNARDLSIRFGIECRPKIQRSSYSLARTIAANAADFDVIIMGTNGPDDVYQFLTGSNAYKAAVNSSIPVLLIPPDCQFHPVRKLVYAFDYLRERKLPLDQLKPFLKIWNCELSVLQVMEEAYSAEAEDELHELQFISRQLYAEDILLNFDTIRSYEIAESIHSYVLRTAPDMLALCTIHRNLLERLFHNSLIRKLSGRASYPVIVFHH